MKKIRVLIPCDDQKAELIAFNYANEICKLSKGLIQEAILFIPGKENIRFTTLSAALGEATAKKLLAGDTFSLPCGIPMRLETIRTLKFVTKPTVLISVYSDQEMLDQVDPITNLFGIVAIPHIPDALEKWQKTWSPVVHGEVEQSAEKLIKDPIFEQALIALTHGVNLSHALLNPRDKEHSNTTLRILHNKGHREAPTNIRSWAIKNGWHPKAANELEALASKTLALKSKPRLENPEVAKNTYEYWCSKV